MDEVGKECDQSHGIVNGIVQEKSRCGKFYTDRIQLVLVLVFVQPLHPERLQFLHPFLRHVNPLSIPRHSLHINLDGISDK